MSIFSAVKKQDAPVEAFTLTKVYEEDTNEHKVNLSIGAYRTEKGEPWVFPVVRQAEKVLAADETLNKEYLPILGLERFTTAATKLLLGDDSQALLESRAFGVQTLSGTGSVRVGAEFLSKHLHFKTFYVSIPAYENHSWCFKCAGFEDGRTYRYWSAHLRGLDIEGMLEDLRSAPEQSVIVLHSSGHNPTGCDPTEEQWKRIADVMEERKLFPFLGCAYQGFTSGDFEKDAWSVRYFASRGFEFFCYQSFAKNFGLYNERIGNMTCVVKDADAVTKVKSQLTLIIRGMYSSPPNHGARVVAYILTNQQLFQELKSCVKKMSSRIFEMRRSLREALEKLGTPGSWEHITSQVGMFSYTGLNEQQSWHMVNNYHVYMMRSGRISLCGLNSNNVDYVARAIRQTLEHIPEQKS